MSPYSIPIILVDDEPALLETEALALRLNGFTSITACAGAAEALAALRERPAAVAVLDVTMPGMPGTELLERVAQEYPDAIVIMLTGLNDAETAAACVKRGAFDYILKPVNQERLVTCVRKAAEHMGIRSEASRLARGMLADRLEDPAAFAGIVTGDRRLGNIFKYIEAVAPTGLPILLTGETGAGKELFAQAIHRASGRKGEFVCVNSAGIDDALFSDTVFGHAAGAFTGAHRDRAGLIERARGGTLFLDEIGDMRPESQVKLLRLLQEGTYYKLGRELEDRSDARIVAATNRGLPELQADPRFRKDLFYRLKSHHVPIPPLRERPGDVVALTEHFLAQAAAEQGKPKPTAPPELHALLANYPFPGNVRELRGMVFDAVSRHRGGILSCQSFKEAMGVGTAKKAPAPPADGEAPIFPSRLPTHREMELALVREALKRAGGNKSLAAEWIGMSRQTFRTKLRDMGGSAEEAGAGAD